MPTNADYAKINIACKELGIDKYELIADRYGVESSKLLKPRQLGDLFHHLKSLGWKPKYKKAREGQTAKPRPITASDEQSKKIRALWITMHKAGLVFDPSELALAKYVKRMTKFGNRPGKDRLEWCGVNEKVHIIEVLKKWQQRDLCQEFWPLRWWLSSGALRIMPPNNLIWNKTTSNR